MPKIVRLREVIPAEMPELERLVKKRTSFEAQPARFILVLAKPVGLSPNLTNWPAWDGTNSPLKHKNAPSPLSKRRPSRWRAS
jgi:hypothetical protein